MRGVPMVLRGDFRADVEIDNGWRNGGSIERGWRGKRESAGLWEWAVERGLVGGHCKRHCGCIRCCTTLEAGFRKGSRRFKSRAAVG